MTLFNVEIISPDGPLYEGQVSQVVLPSTEGDIGILANHIPMIATLMAGDVTLFYPDKSKQIIPIQGGYVNVGTALCTVLVN